MNIQYKNEIKSIEKLASKAGGLFKDFHSTKIQITKYQNKKIKKAAKISPSLIKTEQKIKNLLANEKAQGIVFNESNRQKQIQKQTNINNVLENNKLHEYTAYKWNLKNILGNDNKHNLKKTNANKKNEKKLKDKTQMQFTSFLSRVKPKNLDKNSQIEKKGFINIEHNGLGNIKNINDINNLDEKSLFSSIKDFLSTSAYKRKLKKENRLIPSLRADDNSIMFARQTKNIIDKSPEESYNLNQYSFKSPEPFKIDEKDFFYEPVNLSYAGPGNMATQSNKLSKTYTIEVQGKGKIEFDRSAMKEQLLDTLVENIKPIFIDMLEEEMFTEGEGSYYF